MAKEITLKSVWGLAKSKELRLTDEELHLLVAGHVGKDSLRQLNKRELGIIVGVLLRMKDSNKQGGIKKEWGGNPVTENQRKKIKCLTQELGWEKEERINGLCSKMFKVGRVEWLNYQQCSKIIEALKSMMVRQKTKEKRDEE